MKDLARRINAISRLTGSFVLRSGQISATYFDKYRFESDPYVLGELVKTMVPLIPSNAEALAGLDMGGIPLATALSLFTGLPVVFVRKEAKGYGTAKLVEGIDVAGLTLLVVEDVITTGSQVIISVNQLRELGAHVSNVLCVIDRSQDSGAALVAEKLTMLSVFTMAELNAIEQCEHSAWQDTGFADLDECSECGITRSGTTGQIISDSTKIK